MRGHSQSGGDDAISNERSPLFLPPYYLHNSSVSVENGAGDFSRIIFRFAVRRHFRFLLCGKRFRLFFEPCPKFIG